MAGFGETIDPDRGYTRLPREFDLNRFITAHGVGPDPLKVVRSIAAARLAGAVAERSAEDIAMAEMGIDITNVLKPLTPEEWMTPEQYKDLLESLRQADEDFAAGRSYSTEEALDLLDDED